MPWLPDILQCAFSFERAVVTPYSFVTVFLPAFFAYYVMAVLVQLPRTSLYRTALLPVVFLTTFRANSSLDFSLGHPGYDYMNQALASGMFMVAMRCTAWVFAQRPHTRLPIRRTGYATSDIHDVNTATGDAVPVSSAIWNACDLAVNFRLVGWNEPQKKYIPSPYLRVESRLLFAILSLCQLFFSAFTLDVAQKVIRSYGPETFGTPKGGTIFDSSLPPLERYMKSSSVTLLSAVAGYAMIRTVYWLHAVLFIILFQQRPTQWPPLFDMPWLSTSLTSFWGRRWDQLFRESFVVVGNLLLGRFLGRTGIIIGAFALSGVLHDIGARGMSRGEDTITIVGFFVVHGAGVMMERAWERASGKYVGGPIGWLWTVSYFLLSGHLLVDAWAKTGVLGSEFWPEAYSPTALIMNVISLKQRPAGVD